MIWQSRSEEDYRIFSRIDDRRYLFADECVYPGKGYSAFLHYIDLDDYCSNEQINGVSLMQLIDEEESDEEKAYMIAEFADDPDYETDIFPDEESMWRYVKDNASVLIENINACKC